MDTLERTLTQKYGLVEREIALYVYLILGININQYEEFIGAYHGNY